VTAGGDPLTRLAAAGAQRIGDPSIHCANSPCEPRQRVSNSKMQMHQFAPQLGGCDARYGWWGTTNCV
jgi:hypothetical protein